MLSLDGYGDRTMAIARFFDRIFAAVGPNLQISRASLEERLKTVSVAIFCGPGAEQGNGSLITELCTNICARLYPRMCIWPVSPFTERLIALARSINPAIEFVAREEPATVTIAVGHCSDKLPERSIHVSARGWVAQILMDRESGRRCEPPNPYSSSVAACLACAEAFRRIFAANLPEEAPATEATVSLLDFSPDAGEGLPLPSVDLGEVAVVGLGAVGNAAIWAMARHSGLSGKLWLVDHEPIDLSNLQRYVLTSDDSVDVPKVELARSALKRTRLDLCPRQDRLGDFASSLGDEFLVPTICISIDNVEGRRSAQALLPKLIVNGWTGDTSLGASWHRFNGDSACLACLYHPTGQSKSQTDLVAEALGLPPRRAAELWMTRQPPSDVELKGIVAHLGADEALMPQWWGLPLAELYTRMVCGSAAIDIHGRGRLEVVPLVHQSVLAGALMAAELVKRATPELEVLSGRYDLVGLDDILRPPPKYWTRRRPRVCGCICSDADYQNVYRDKWLTSTG